MTDEVMVSLSQDTAGKLDRLFKDSSLNYADMISKVVDYTFADLDDFDEQDYREISLAVAEVNSGKFYTSKDVDDMISAKKE